MADKTKAEPGAGDITITLAGKEHTMQPTLQACMALSKFSGGLAMAARKCMALDFETICEIISIGTGYTSLENRKLIQEAVFETGMIFVAADCGLFIRAVQNGGRIPSDDEDEGGEGNEPDAPLSAQSSSTPG